MFAEKHCALFRIHNFYGTHFDAANGYIYIYICHARRGLCASDFPIFTLFFFLVLIRTGLLLHTYDVSKRAIESTRTFQYMKSTELILHSPDYPTASPFGQSIGNFLLAFISVEIYISPINVTGIVICLPKPSTASHLFQPSLPSPPLVHLCPPDILSVLNGDGAQELGGEEKYLLNNRKNFHGGFSSAKSIAFQQILLKILIMCADLYYLLIYFIYMVLLYSISYLFIYLFHLIPFIHAM